MAHFTCNQCDKIFSHRSGLRRHMKMSHGTGNRYKCSTCNKEFLRKDVLNRHMKVHENRKVEPMELDRGMACEGSF